MSVNCKIVYLLDQAGALCLLLLSEVPGIGFQVPPDAIDFGHELEAPTEGFVWAMVDGEAVQRADHRGTVYSTATGEPEVFDALGELPAGLTLDPPPGPFYVWQAGAWELDAAAQAAAQSLSVKSERDSRMATAQLRIAPLKYAADLDMATETERAALLAWMRYSVELNRIQDQPDYPAEITWPAPPA
jgi:hypothetical protein